VAPGQRLARRRVLVPRGDEAAWLEEQVAVPVQEFRRQAAVQIRQEQERRVRGTDWSGSVRHVHDLTSALGFVALPSRVDDARRPDASRDTAAGVHVGLTGRLLARANEGEIVMNEPFVQRVRMDYDSSGNQDQSLST